MANIYKLPSAVVSTIFSFTALTENISLSSTSRWMQSVSLLPTSSPIELILRTPERANANTGSGIYQDDIKFKVMPNLARFRPQKLRCVGNSAGDLMTKQMLGVLTFYGYFGHQSPLRQLSLQLDDADQKSTRRVWRTLEMIGDCTRLVDYGGLPLLEHLDLEWLHNYDRDTSTALKKLTSLKTIVLRNASLNIISNLPPSITDLTIVEGENADAGKDLALALRALSGLRRLSFYAMPHSLEHQESKIGNGIPTKLGQPTKFLKVLGGR